ncbi:MAG: non-heme iron oxygenase ferredoxin subunit [Armatimonadetes bacterium]|nr:non-heme iron oxygenase ferredoxin subunit [Armatimonadota bacterium]
MAEFVRVATTDEVPPGAAKVVEVAGERIALFNLGGTVYAIHDTCTHEEASLAEGDLYGEVVACPKHGSRFHVPSGRVLSLPAVKSVAVYPVKVEGADIYVSPEGQVAKAKPHRR